MEEERALCAVKNGDTEAMGWLIERYVPYVATIVGRIFSNALSTADVEEVSSDVFVALWENAAAVQPDCLKAWLGAVARNRARNRLRARRLEVPLEDDAITVNLNSMQEDAERRELYGAVRTAVLEMAQPDREIFLRHYYDYQPVADIGVQLHMSESAVKSRLRRGREKLKQILIREGFANAAQNQ